MTERRYAKQWQATGTHPSCPFASGILNADLTEVALA
jgi:hypothetical protein